MSLTPEMLAANAEVLEQLSWSFDLCFGADPAQPQWFSVDGVDAIRPIARDSTGGVFALLAGSPRVLYVSSEGAAGILAASLEEFINLVVACPYWHDLLKFSGNGNLDEMRRAAAVLDAGTVGDDDLAEARGLLKSLLGLPNPLDSVGSLHQAVSTSNVVVRGLDGGVYRSLFNSFVIDEDRMRRLLG